MQDNTNIESPDASGNYTNKEAKNHVKDLKVKSIISRIIIALGIGLIISIVFNRYIYTIKKLDIKEQVFKLSDNSTLLFLNDNEYLLNYQIMNEDIVMKGDYKITYGERINENILYEYKNYIEKLDSIESILGFLELQNNELYINNKKMENSEGYINTYYILMAHFEDNTLVFNGYNVDTGIEIEFTQQIGEYKQYYKKFVK